MLEILLAAIFFGLSPALTNALLAVGYAGMTLSEIALGTAVLAPAIATFSILDAVTSVVLGVTLLEERLRDDAVGIALIVVSLGVMFAGLAVLAGAEGAREEPRVPEPT